MGFWLFLLGIFVVAVWPRPAPKPDTSYNPRNVMGDGEFSSDEDLLGKGGKLRLR